MNFLISFAKACGEYMVPYTTKLLGIGLVPRLLLLVTLTGLLVIVALVTLTLISGI